ncbi:MAG: hypothetical protein C0467_02575 [Planctomycetaceae bacterium]|nr:hypothetical protein [Planctomycetaceae bacterium]
MPEDDPDKLDAAGSKKVAEYIYDKFYSPQAQARIRPPRVELSHLTIRQYRNAIADIVGSFRFAPKFDDKQQGLRGEYFNSRGFDGNKRLIQRNDGEVSFDFKVGGPDGTQPVKVEPKKDDKKEPPKKEPEKKDPPKKEEPKKEPEKKEPPKFDPHQFSIRWEGSVLAPETGLYDFVVKTDQALRLWVNDNKRPLIDAWVKSGTDTEYHGSAFLLAGRPYPVRLEFSKAKQGVDDSKKNPNPPPKNAFISLNWKRPKGTLEVIPARHLLPVKFPEVAVIESPFPPDDRSLGWERGTSISKEWESATTDGAIEAAAYVLTRLPELAGTTEGAKDRDVKLKAFCLKFAERAFRRPLTDDEKKLFIDRQFEGAGADLDLAVKRVLLFVLKSPRFLYPDAAQLPENYAVAAKLALTLWDAFPDSVLLEAAAKGQLTNRAEVAKQAERMLADPKAKAKIREFLFIWLKLDQSPELAKDPKRFPGFDANIAADLRTSLEMFLDDVVWNDGDFRKLLTSDDLYLNGRLAKFYGVTLPADAGFTKVSFEADKRSGIVTHPYMLSVLAYNAETSPIHRGVFVARGLLGISIRPPKDAFTPLAADLHPKLTTRERVLLQTKPAACAGCHSVMNPLGFALENFDAVGRYRAKENDKPVDSVGSYDTRAGATAKFTGAKELAKFLAGSPEVAGAFTERMFHHMVKQPVMAFGISKPDELEKTFSENGFNVRKLVVDIAVTAATTKNPPK